MKRFQIKMMMLTMVLSMICGMMLTGTAFAQEKKTIFLGYAKTLFLDTRGKYTELAEHQRSVYGKDFFEKNKRLLEDDRKDIFDPHIWVKEEFNGRIALAFEDYSGVKTKTSRNCHYSYALVCSGPETTETIGKVIKTPLFANYRASSILDICLNSDKMIVKKPPCRQDDKVLHLNKNAFLMLANRILWYVNGKSDLLGKNIIKDEHLKLLCPAIQNNRMMCTMQFKLNMSNFIQNIFRHEVKSKETYSIQVPICFFDSFKKSKQDKVIEGDEIRTKPMQDCEREFQKVMKSPVAVIKPATKPGTVRQTVAMQAKSSSPSSQKDVRPKK